MSKDHLIIPFFNSTSMHMQAFRGSIKGTLPTTTSKFKICHDDVIIITYEEVLFVVVPDTTTVWPVTCHTGASEEWGNWFVEEEMISDQLILSGFGHFVKWEIFA